MGDATEAWGLMQLEEQQLAGLIMWVPGGITHLVVAIVLMMVLLREPDRRPHPVLER